MTTTMLPSPLSPPTGSRHYHHQQQQHLHHRRHVQLDGVIVYRRKPLSGRRLTWRLTACRMPRVRSWMVREDLLCLVPAGTRWRSTTRRQNPRPSIRTTSHSGWVISTGTNSYVITTNLYRRPTRSVMNNSVWSCCGEWWITKIVYNIPFYE